MAFAKKSAKPKWENVWGTEFWTDDVRLQFVHLKEIDTSGEFPRKKFCVMALVDQNDEAGLAIITEGICSVVSEYLGKEVDIDDIEKHPLLDKNGDIRDGNGSDIEGAEGCYYFTPVANEENPVECLALPEDGDADGVYEIDPDEIYAGCYARLLLIPWMYADGCVTFALRSVVKTADGDRFKTAQAVSAKSSFVKKWGAKNGSAAAAEETEEAAAPAKKAGRGRPAGALNKKSAAPVEPETEEEGEEQEQEETPTAPVKKGLGGLAGLNGAKKKVFVKTDKVNAAGGRLNPPDEDDDTPAPAPVKKGLSKAKGLSSRL